MSKIDVYVLQERVTHAKDRTTSFENLKDAVKAYFSSIYPKTLSRIGSHGNLAKDYSLKELEKLRLKFKV